MIKINNFSNSKNNRYISDLIEPFIVKQIQKKYHTFFVYRCSDYISFKHLLRCYDFDVSNLSKSLIYLVSEYWSAIDAIYFDVEKVGDFVASKKYFENIESLCMGQKFVCDIRLFEIKVCRKGIKPNLSMRTYELSNKLTTMGRILNFILISTEGVLKIKFDEQDLVSDKFEVRTHYGRKKKQLKLKSN